MIMKMWKAVSIASLFVFCIPMIALTAYTVNDASLFLETTAERTGVPLENVETITGRIVRGAAGAVGTLFFVLMIYGGYLWMTARGSEEQVTKARNIIIAAIIGLVIVVGAYAATTFIVRAGAQSAAPGGVR